jgi:hypothetical protein
MILQNCKKIEVRDSPVEGFGVFATDDIKAGEVLEEIPFILFPRHTNLSKVLYDTITNAGFGSPKEQYFENLRVNLKFKDPEKYYFKWMPPQPLNGEAITYTVLPLGFGPIYNTSNTDNNAGWMIREKTFIFKADRDIKKDEEIRTFYGYFVGQDGSIFNCNTVFNLGFDTFNGKTKMRMVRFSTVQDFESSKQNPIFVRLSQLLTESVDGLTLVNVSASLMTGEEKASMNVSDDIPLNTLYQKLLEFYQSPLPIIKMIFKYQDKATGAERAEGVAFKK